MADSLSYNNETANPAIFLPFSQYNSSSQTSGTIAANVIAGALENFLLLTGSVTALTTATAAQIYQLLQGLVPHMRSFQFRFRIANNGGQSLTITAGTGVVATGTLTVSSGTWREFDVTVTSPTSVAFKSVGTGTYT